MFVLIISLFACGTQTEEVHTCPPPLQQMEVEFENRNGVEIPGVILGVTSCDWDESLAKISCSPSGWRENEDGTVDILSTGGESTITYMVTE